MKRIVIILILLLGGLAARADNIVSVSSASGHPQDEVTFNVSLTNTDAAVAFQAEIPLGSQLTYVSGSATLNPDRINGHQVTAAVVGGNLRIFVYSLSLTPFEGNDGNLLSFTLRLKNEPGDYILDMGGAILSDVSGAALPVTTQNGTVSILSPKLQINTPTIDYGHVPIRSEYTQYAQLSNVGNEPLVITNITFSDGVFSCPSFAETTLQAGQSTSFTFKFAPTVKGAVTATATIVSNSISGNGIINLVADPFAVNEIHIGNTTGYCDSIVEVPISMNNMEGIIGFQIEFDLNPALEFVDFSLSNRKTNHVSTGVVSGTTLRLMAYSPSGAAFTGDDGEIGTVRFRLHGLYGNYYLNPFKAVLADANGEDVLSDSYYGYVTVRSPQVSGNSSLDFGSSPVTEIVTREYVVYNNGNASMRIDQVIFDQADFAVAETFPITVNQYSNTTLHVSYSREQKGDFNALMKIYSNDPQNGLKNVTLSGSRYEPNSLEMTADPFSLGGGDVAVTLSLNNYSAIVALQANFNYPYHDYSVQASDFQLTERFSGHSLYAIPINDSTFRILVLSMQNTPVEGHDGAVLDVTLHPVGTPSEEEYTVSVTDVVLSNVTSENLFTGEDVSVTYALFINLPIIGYGNSVGGYYLIAPPIDNVDPADIEGMTEGDFDLYYFDEGEELEWRNYEASAFNLVSGKGYLYAHRTDVTLTFTGTPYNGNGQVTLSKDGNASLGQWNLIGNPLNANATLGTKPFYIMNEGGTDIIAADNDHSVIAPMQGVFVEADSNGETVTFTPASAKGRADNEGCIVLNLAQNSAVIDRAIVRMGKCEALPKLQIRDGNTKVYILQDGEEYAIVSSDGRGELPVNFRAAENGTYTLTANLEGVEMEYLHLIDNLTGADIDLLQTPEYTFNAKRSDNANRFKVVFVRNDKE